MSKINNTIDADPVLSEEQKRALKILSEKVYTQPVTVLQGYAGTGKSFTISKFLEYSLFKRVAFVAYTGTAAKVLSNENPGLETSTIHSLIYKPIRGGDYVQFVLKSPEELSHLELIVVDEFSMVDGKMMSQLLSFGKPLILVGDPFQLPAFNKTYPNPYLNQVDALLTEVHRQALDNPVLSLATDIRNGATINPGIYGKNGEIYVGKRGDIQDSWYNKDVQFLCGTNATREAINAKVAKNPKLQIGEKIIFLKNDFESDITNGTLATVSHFIKGSGNRYVLTGETNNGEPFSKYLAYYQQARTYKDQFFDRAYAITVHKAQGQTIDAPLVIIDESRVFGADAQRWLYTAVNR